VDQALRRMGHDVIGMEQYVAEQSTPLERCLQDVRTADVYLVIVAWRYGYSPEDERLNPQTQISSQPAQADQLFETARGAFNSGRDADALTALGKLLQVSPQHYDAHLLMGRVYERKGDFDRAINALKAAVFWNPKLGPAHVLLGRIAVLKNDCVAAQGSADKALQVDPNDQDAQALKRLIEQKCKAAS